MVASTRELCGWSPNPEGVDRIIADPLAPVEDWSTLIANALRPTCLDADELVRDGREYAAEERWQRDFGPAPTLRLDWRALRDEAPVFLYEPLLRLSPNWKRGRQGIGDCVSWGWELICTILSGIQIVILKRPELWRGEFATEAIYGGSRVEANGGQLGGYSDGSYGGAAAKWITKWGGLLRVDYSVTTGIAEHDLRVYDSEKAKAWGNFGCGGKGESRGDGKLDLIAREHPVKSAARVLDFDAAALAIVNGYPIAVCSGYGFGRRGKSGFLSRQGSWSHCMAFIGVRFDDPALLLVNSWGPSWGMNDPHWPENIPPAIRVCSGWVRRADVTGMLRGGDSYAVSDYAGFVRRPLTWENGGTIGRGARRRLQRKLLAA